MVLTMINGSEILDCFVRPESVGVGHTQRMFVHDGYDFVVEGRGKFVTRASSGWMVRHLRREGRVSSSKRVVKLECSPSDHQRARRRFL